MQIQLNLIKGNPMQHNSTKKMVQFLGSGNGKSNNTGETYEELVELLLRTTSPQEIEVIKNKLKEIREQEQKQKENTAQDPLDLLVNTGIVVLNCIEGIEKQPEFNLLTETLRNNELSTNIAEFINSEIAALRNNPMASCPEYQLNLETLIKPGLSPEFLECLQKLMVQDRESKQAMVKLFLNCPNLANRLLNPLVMEAETTHCNIRP